MSGGVVDVAVVGGGVIGLAVAWRARRAGASVTLLDPAPGQAASWVAGGMLAPVAEAAPGEDALVGLTTTSAACWPAFVAELAEAAGTDPGYTRHGTLVVARDGDEVAQLDEAVAVQRAAGLAPERVTSRQARRLEPALAPSVRGALWLPDDHQIDNRLLVGALLAACRNAGVELRAERAASIDGHEVISEGGHRLAAGHVVAATGAWPPPLRRDGKPLAVPVRPVKGQILRVHARPGAVYPRRTVRGLDVYVIPRDHGEIAIGATSEERGYDTAVTAGGVLELLRRAWELLPGLAEATFVEARAGLRPGTPDNFPLLGALPGGPLVATGHYRHGVLLTPVTAEVVTGWITGTLAPDLAALVRPFHPARFGPELGAPPRDAPDRHGDEAEVRT